MFVEITREAFNLLVSTTTVCTKTEQLEHGYKMYYNVAGVVLLKVDNYCSCITQFYIQDINA